jgi:hypothetical protein
LTAKEVNEAMTQASLGLNLSTKRTRKREFVEEMERVVNDLLGARGLLLKSGTMVDATLIAAPSSTKTLRCTRRRKAISGTSG